MLSAFKEFIEKRQLHGNNDKVLLAVSGGIDSSVMAHLYHLAGYSFGMAHCNFSLRGTESDADQEFVEQLSHKYIVSVHTRKFDTQAFASEHGISVQMAARSLRYEWFTELIRDHGYACVAVAHHADDVAETILLNLTRGTGIAGLHGIPDKRDLIVRPLLFATRNSIESFAFEQKITWREDSSNAESTYLRNRIRHQVMPVLREINPLVAEAFGRHAVFMEGYEKLVAHTIESIRNSAEWRNETGGAVSFSLPDVLDSAAPEVVLFLLLKPYGINLEMSNAVSTMKSGAEILTPGWRIVRDRNRVVIFSSDAHKPDDLLWYLDGSTLQLTHGFLSQQILNFPPNGVMSEIPQIGNPDYAFLDSEKLQYPLEVRRWKHGDTFRPLGMSGTKLVSDFITDEKMDAISKEHVLLLISGGEVAWMIGKRIDDRFKVTSETRQITCIRFHRYTTA